jgi:hypothetical protein
MFVTVEGDLDAAAAGKILQVLSISATRIDPEGGKQKIRPKMPRLMEASLMRDWMVIVDLDNDECPARLVDEWCGGAEHKLIFRVAVREIEAWLLADHERAAAFLGVRKDVLPINCDAIPDPKNFLVGLARQSSKRMIREGIVPRVGSGRSTGPQYTSLLGGFAAEQWDPLHAAQRSTSLDRCIKALRLRFGC